MPVRLFSGRPRTPTRKKSLRPSKTAAPFRGHEEEVVVVRGYPKGTCDVELEAPESGQFRGTASLLAKTEQRA